MPDTEGQTPPQETVPNTPKAKTIQQALAETYTEISRPASDNDKAVLGEIQGTIIQLQGQGEKAYEDMSPDELSQLMSRLAVLSVNLGEMISKAQREWRISCETAKFRKANMRDTALDHVTQAMVGKQKPTVADVEAYITSNLFTTNIREHFYEEQYSRLQHLWWSVKNIISSLEHRMMFVQSSMKMQSYDRLGHVDDIQSFPVPQKD